MNEEERAELLRQLRESSCFVGRDLEDMLNAMMKSGFVGSSVFTNPYAQKPGPPPHGFRGTPPRPAPDPGVGVKPEMKQLNRMPPDPQKGKLKRFDQLVQDFTAEIFGPVTLPRGIECLGRIPSRIDGKTLLKHLYGKSTSS